MAAPASGFEGPLIDLTPTERRILDLRLSGLHRTEIALLLNRSPQTISNSLTLAKEKLGARSLMEAAALVARASTAPEEVSWEEDANRRLQMKQSAGAQPV
jgi:DNA-binding CsgD family transcriptional regulator